MSRKPILPGDRVYVTLIGEGPRGEPFPYYFEGAVIAIHDECVTVCDDAGNTMGIKRERVITQDQLERLSKRFLRE